MTTTVIEKPENGLAGLKHWRQDLTAGLLVSLISLPFSLGIAVASGAPPICGVISAIIAGFVLPFLGGSYVTISGPAAGLAPVLLAGMLTLGNGSLEVGYPLLLVAISLTGCVQVVLSLFKAARFAAIFPAAVVEGMLAAIGLLIIAKQLPLLLGHSFEAHEFWGILSETPKALLSMNPQVFILGVVSLAAIFGLAALESRWLRIVPPQVIVVALGTLAGLFVGFDQDYRVFIPENPLSHGIVLPNVQGVLADSSLWWPLAAIVLTLTMIDGVESLATIAAIDKIDPYRRKSDPNRTLFSMGVSNLCSSFAGGLTIIPGGVKSTAGILGGARTQWANFYNACFLLLFLLAGREVINLIPFSVLAAVLIYTGFKLCRPLVWRHVTHIGTEQLWIFAVTVLVTISTDLLWGIAAGIASKFALDGWYAMTAARSSAGLEGAPEGQRFWRLVRLTTLFRNPVVKREMVDGEFHLFFGSPMTCFNSLQLSQELADIPQEAKSIKLHITSGVTLIDHTACDSLLSHVYEHNQRGTPPYEIIGIELMRKRSEYSSCMRFAPIEADQVIEAT